MEDDKLDQLAHHMADEIYFHMENDHVRDDFITWIDLFMLIAVFVLIAIVPVWGASFAIFPNVFVKGYQIVRRYRRNNSVKGNYN